MADGSSPGNRIGRRGVLAGLAGVGVAATGALPVPATGRSEPDTVVLGDFESGLDGWRTAGEHLLGTVSASERPGAVTRGQRALEVTVTGDLLPSIWNEERVRRGDFVEHPYFVADVTPGVVSGTGSDVTFKLRYVHGDVPLGDTLGEYSLADLPGVYESDEITVPPLVPSRLFWDVSGLPDGALSDPQRLEVLWYPTDVSLDLDLGLDGLASGFDYLGEVVFDHLRLSGGVEAVSAARLENLWRDLQLDHGAYLETAVTSRGDEREEGVFVFDDGTLVPYAFEVVADGAYRYEVDGIEIASGGGVVGGETDGAGTPDVDRPSRPPSAARNTASATVLTYIPGFSENTTDGGGEYDSAMPDVSEYIDNAFHGDNRTSLEASLSEATELDKALAEYPEQLFPHYRVRNGVSASLSSSDGRRIDGRVRVSSGEESSLSPITLEGEESEGDNPYRANLDAHHDGEEVKAPLPREHFVSHTTFDVDGVEGVRASTIYGGVDRYIVEFLDAIRAGGPLELLSTSAAEAGAYVLDHVLALPAFYSFLELTLMADGTRVARIWDAGQYPRHALYVDGARVGESDFDHGEEWREDEQVNARFTRWGSESKLALHPYKSPHLAYEQLFWTGGGPHPLLVGGEDGGTLTAEEVVEATPMPHFPF